jgi:hypothetical protein
MDQSITVQFSYGSISVTCQLEGTGYSPDVFNDILTQGVRALKQASSETPKEDDSYKVLTLEELFERFDNDEND